jgi:hypothetical protein
MARAYNITDLQRAAAASGESLEICIATLIACSIDAGVGGAMPSDLYLDKMLQ